MKKVLVVMVLVLVIPLMTSCVVHNEAVKGAGRGTTEIVEGAGRGTTELGKGTVEAVKDTTVATGQLLTGRDEEAAQSGKDAINAGAEGVKAVITKPLEGLEKGLQEIDAGIKRATRPEDVK